MENLKKFAGLIAAIALIVSATYAFFIAPTPSAKSFALSAGLAISGFSIVFFPLQNPRFIGALTGLTGILLFIHDSMP
jgi:hypothetical protein